MKNNCSDGEICRSRKRLRALLHKTEEMNVETATYVPMGIKGDAEYRSMKTIRLFTLPQADVILGRSTIISPTHQKATALKGKW
jgi:hypothetical protein